MKRLFLKMTAAAAVGSLVGACGGTDSSDDVSPGSLLEVAARSGEISALGAAARSAGLEDVLAAAGAGLTVLAPTNDAWALLSGQLGFRSIQQLIDALPQPALASILRYHVLPARLSRADLLGRVAPQNTLLARDGVAVALPLSTAGGDLRITDEVGRVAVTNLFDVPADNGLFHVIDRVLMPSGLLNVLQTVQSNPERFGALAGALLSLPTPNALAATLSGSAPVTLFAPVNRAFETAAPTLGGLTPEQLGTLLRYHLVSGVRPSTALPLGTPLQTLAGQPFTVNGGATPPALATIDDASATDANITAVDIVASNGVVHVIDKVLRPVLAAAA